MQMRKIVVLAVALLLTACGSSLKGTWTDDMGMSKYTFGSDGKVVQSTMGIDVEMDYETDGDKVRLKTPMGTLLMTQLDKDTLSGPMGVKLHREK